MKGPASDKGPVSDKISQNNYFLTSQKNSLPRKPQNHEIQDTSSELLILFFFIFIIYPSLKRDKVLVISWPGDQFWDEEVLEI